MAKSKDTASPIVFARATFNQNVGTLKTLVQTFDKDKFKAGMDLGASIIAYATAKTANVKKSERMKAFNMAKTMYTKDAAKRTGVGESTIREYVRFNMPKNAEIIRTAKAKTVPACRLALKGTGDPKNGGGDTTGKTGATVSTPTTATQTVNSEGEPVIGGEVIDETPATDIDNDVTNDLETQAGRIMIAVMNSISKNSVTDQDIILDMIMDGLKGERARLTA